MGRSTIDVASVFSFVHCALTLDDAVFDWTGVRAPVVDEILEDVFGRFGLSGATLATDDDGLTLLQDFHVAVSLVSCTQERSTQVSNINNKNNDSIYSISRP